MAGSTIGNWFISFLTFFYVQAFARRAHRELLVLPLVVVGLDSAARTEQYHEERGCHDEQQYDGQFEHQCELVEHCGD